MTFSVLSQKGTFVVTANCECQKSSSIHLDAFQPFYVLNLQLENEKLRTALKRSCNCRPGGSICPACIALKSESPPALKF